MRLAGHRQWCKERRSSDQSILGAGTLLQSRQGGGDAVRRFVSSGPSSAVTGCVWGGGCCSRAPRSLPLATPPRGKRYQIRQLPGLCYQTHCKLPPRICRSLHRGQSRRLCRQPHPSTPGLHAWRIELAAAGVEIGHKTCAFLLCIRFMLVGRRRPLLLVSSSPEPHSRPFQPWGSAAQADWAVGSLA
jgi:hypothetical protein